MEQQETTNLLRSNDRNGQDNPQQEMLYHYTSLESLALILRNHTIRLHPLDVMDDLQEQKTADVPNLGKFIFVSAWTSEKEESIPMWKMYSGTEEGVRIALPKDPFSKSRITGEDLERAGVFWFPGKEVPGEIECFLDPVEMLSKGYITRQTFADSILTKVEYTDDMELLEPKASTLLQGIEVGNFTPLGRYKNKYWAFQQECRYLLEFVPMRPSSPLKMVRQYQETVGRMLQGVEEAPFPFFDLPIAPEAYSKMEIVTGPHMLEGNQILLETLVEKYNPDAKVTKSDLLNLI